MGSTRVDLAAGEKVVNSPEVRKALLNLAYQILEESQRLVPVDTGHLKSTGEIVDNGDTISIGYTAEYAAYVEMGTRDMPAQPYLRPASLRRREVR